MKQPTLYQSSYQKARGNHHAFGMVMPDRNWNGKSYRYGFNNQELDTEFGPDIYSFEYRIHDARLGRFLSMDPLTSEYPAYTPYSFAANQPIHAVELEGLESSDDKNPTTTAEAVEEGVKEGVVNFAQGLFWSIGPLPAVKKGIDFYNTYQESDGGWLEYAKNATNHIPVVKDYIMADDVRNAYGESQSAGIQKTTATVTEAGLTVFTALVLHKVSERSSSNSSSGVAEVGETASRTGLTAPEGWITKASKKGGGTIFQDPNNPHNSIRQMPGNPDSPNPAQRNPYVIFKKHGIAYDVNGKPLRSATDPGAHIPLDQFDINKMPKFE